NAEHAFQAARPAARIRVSGLERNDGRERRERHHGLCDVLAGKTGDAAVRDRWRRDQSQRARRAEDRWLRREVPTLGDRLQIRNEASQNALAWDHAASRPHGYDHAGGRTGTRRAYRHYDPPRDTA